MPAAPVPQNEHERTRTLERFCLRGEPDETADHFAAVTAAVAGCPTALVSIVQGDRQWFMGSFGLDVRETPRDQAFCAYTILGTEPVVVPDATEDPRFADNPLVTGDFGLRYYAGFPLIAEDGIALGSLCVLDYTPREPDPARLEAMRRLRELVIGYLRTRRESIVQRDASEAKSAFLANMSHEIRTPLAAVIGYAELIEHADVDHPVDTAEAAGTIVRNGRHLLGVMNNVLDMSKLDAGRVQPESIAFDPAELVRDTAALFAFQASSKGITLETDIDPGVPDAVRSDPTRLRQVFQNLIGNALKFTEKGSVRVSLRYEPGAGSENNSEGRLVGEIRDTGIGMPPQTLAKIRKFEPFCQADLSTTRRFGGTGLGLSISVSILRLLGGSLEVESAEDIGSTFRVTVGAPVDEAGRTADDRVCRVTLAEPKDALSGLRILLADDSPDVLRLFRHLLTRKGADVETVEDGAALIARVCGPDPAEPDLIISDLHMPMADGTEAARAIRETGRAVPMIALSAESGPDTEARCLAAGFDLVLPKTVTRDGLIGACVQLGTRGSKADRTNAA